MNTLTYRRNRGFALASAIIILASLTLLAVTMSHRVAINEMMAANQRDLVTALMVAESGIEQGYATVKSTYVDHDRQRWLDGLFTLQDNVVSSGSVPGGNYVVTVDRIDESDGGVVAVLNSVGDSNGASREIEIVMEMRSNPGGRYAILTEADINAISGNPTIYGPYADVHTNSDLIISGNPVITGTVSASGSINISGSPILGGSTSGAANVEIPYVYPPDYRDFRTIRFSADCRVYRANRVNGVIVSETYLANANSNKWHGWDCAVNDKWTMGSSDASDMYDAFFYVEGNVVISGSFENAYWYATIVAEGYIEVSGNAWFKPWGSHANYTTGNDIADAILYYAGNDLKINGNPSQQFFGVIATHQEVSVSGNPYLEASIVAENGLYYSGQEVRSGQEVKNIVDQNYFSGDMILNSSGNTPLHTAKRLQVTAWRELVN